MHLFYFIVMSALSSEVMADLWRTSHKQESTIILVLQALLMLRTYVVV